MATVKAATEPGGPALELSDILDLRAYERVRDDYRRQVMALKRVRRVNLGPIMTAVFESPETMRFQVQEMARVERIATDEALLEELEVYNALLPGRGELSATLFVELTTEEELRHWLPRLVGVERALAFELSDLGRAGEVRSEPEAAHAESLTREAITPAVHYLRFAFDQVQVEALERGPAWLVVRHPEYEAQIELGRETRQALVEDLQGRSGLLTL